MSRLDDPAPTEITLHSASRVLEIAFDDGRDFKLPFEFLRVYSPSAEVRGHGPGQETLQLGKREVTITKLEPIGHYAVRPSCSPTATSTGIYSWQLPVRAGRRTGTSCGREYLAKLGEVGGSRDPGDPRNAAIMAPDDAIRRAALIRQRSRCHGIHRPAP